jgi:N-acetylmuramoyl-L-alanine amidase
MGEPAQGHRREVDVKVDGAHHLCSDAGERIRFQPSWNVGGSLIDPRALLIHYTAGRGLQQSADWLCNPRAKASAHLIVGVDGSVMQLVRFDRVAWHAGPSLWEGEERLNDWSFGIELDNPGKLRRTASGWTTEFGDRVADHDVVIDDHGRGWHAFSNEQIVAAYEACEALIDRYPSIHLVLGHSEVAVPAGRKSDPGPAFPMDTFRGWLLGRGEG